MTSLYQSKFAFYAPLTDLYDLKMLYDYLHIVPKKIKQSGKECNLYTVLKKMIAFEDEQKDDLYGNIRFEDKDIQIIFSTLCCKDIAYFIIYTDTNRKANEFWETFIDSFNEEFHSHIQFVFQTESVKEQCFINSNLSHLFFQDKYYTEIINIFTGEKIICPHYSSFQELCQETLKIYDRIQQERNKENDDQKKENMLDVNNIEKLKEKFSNIGLIMHIFEFQHS